MSRKPLLILLMLLLLTSCATEAPSAPHYTGVPIPPWQAADQKKVADLIEFKCGKPPACPTDAVLERAVLDYVKLRNEVRAAGQ